jgi:hypothetical protein
VFVVVGAQVCLLPETSIFSPGFLNIALSKVSLCAGELLLRVGEMDETDVEGSALGDVIQFGTLSRQYFTYFILRFLWCFLFPSKWMSLTLGKMVGQPSHSRSYEAMFRSSGTPSQVSN